MSTALPSPAKSELIAMVPPAPGWLSRQVELEQIVAALVADRVALAAAIAEFAEIAVDRHLRLLAVVAARDDVEDGLLAGELLQHALADIEQDRRPGRARTDAQEAARLVLHDLGLGVGRRADRGRVGRREHADPVAVRIGRARNQRRGALLRDGVKSSSVTVCGAVRTAVSRSAGVFRRPVW